LPKLHRRWISFLKEFKKEITASGGNGRDCEEGFTARNVSEPTTFSSEDALDTFSDNPLGSQDFVKRQPNKCQKKH